MWRNDPKFSKVRQEHDILRSQGEHVSSMEAINPTHPHSGFCQFFDILLTLQVLELVTELIIGTVIRGKLWDEIQPTYLTTSSPMSDMYLFNVAMNLE